MMCISRIEVEMQIAPPETWVHIRDISDMSEPVRTHSFCLLGMICILDNNRMERRILIQ